MTTIQITIDVQNPGEVVEKNKGKWMSFFASMMDEQKLKQEVETNIAKEMVKQLELSIPEGLKEKGIQATVTFSHSALS